MAAAMADLAWTYLLAGAFTDAERAYREAVRLDGANLDALFGLGYCLDLRGAPEEAMRTYRRAMQLLGLPPPVIARSDRAFATSGLPGVYASWLENVRSIRGVPRFMLAFYAAAAGRRAEAIVLLRESSARREAGTLWLDVHPAFASLRGQREFDALVASSFQAR
jgi:tetratricopeptide (TPR) repeat protein